MSKGRIALIVTSLAVVLMLLGGGMLVKVGAADGSDAMNKLFAQALSRIDEYYVDPVEGARLYEGACEGVMAGLDPRGAFLTPEEVAEWNAAGSGNASLGMSVLRGYGVLQVVAVSPESPAEAAGIEPGNQVRRLDDLTLRERSIDQVWRLLRGAPGTTVRVEIVYPDDGFRHEEVMLARVTPTSKPYELDIERGVGILRVLDLARIPGDKLFSDLEDLRSGGVDTLLVDLRNVVEREPARALGFAGLFHSGDALELHDKSSGKIEKFQSGNGEKVWQGALAVLVNGATAGGSEAIAALFKDKLGARVFGESTYGMATEPEFFRLEDGTGILISVAVWNVAGGDSWIEDGLEPDQVIRGQGKSFAERMHSQLESVIDALDEKSGVREQPEEGLSIE